MSDDNLVDALKNATDRVTYDILKVKLGSALDDAITDLAPGNVIIKATNLPTPESFLKPIQNGLSSTWNGFVNGFPKAPQSGTVGTGKFPEPPKLEKPPDPLGLFKNNNR